MFMEWNLNLEKHKKRMAESRELLETTHRFEEPERVPIIFNIHDTFICKLYGYNLRDFYTNLDLQVLVQLMRHKWCFDVLGDDRTGMPGVGPNLGAVGEAKVFDCQIVYPDDVPPWCVRRIKTPEDIDKLEIPDPRSHRGIQDVYRAYEEFKRKVEGLGLSVQVEGGLGIHPPMSAACAIMDPLLVCKYMYTDPDLIHRFFQKLLKTYHVLIAYQDEYYGTETKGNHGLCDDHAMFASPELYRKFILPYNRAIYERYGPGKRSLHMDGPADHLFPILADELKLNSMDIGGYSDIVKAKEAFNGKVVISAGGISNREFYGDFEATKKAINHCISIAAPGGGYVFGIGGSVDYGADPQNLIQAVKYIKKMGRYPIIT